MKRLLQLISIIIFICSLFLKAQAQNTTQTLNNGETTAPVIFGGLGCQYMWQSDKAGIGLPSTRGTGNIPAFTATNTGTTRITATITATPVQVPVSICMVSKESGRITYLAPGSAPPGYSGGMAGSQPFGVSLSPDGNMFYVANKGSGTISVIPTGQSYAVAEVPVSLDNPASQAAPEGLAVSPDGNWVYVANAGDDKVAIIDTRTPKLAFTIGSSGGRHPSGVAVSPDGNWVYVTNNESGNVAVIKITVTGNTISGEVKATIPTGINPEGVVVSNDGKTLYVANTGSDNVSVFNITTPTAAALVTSINLDPGSKPFGLALSHNGNTLYVANSGTDQVAMINAASATPSLTRTFTLDAGTNPHGISTTADDTQVCVGNYNDVAFAPLINVADGSITKLATITAGNFSFGNFIRGGRDCNSTPVTVTYNIDPTSPAINATGPIAPLNGSRGNPSASASFTASGVTLSERITITAPPGFELSTDNITFSPVIYIGAAGNVAPTTIYVRLAASAPVGTYTDVIRLHANAAADVTLQVSGTVDTSPYIATGPVTGKITACAGSPSASVQQFTVSAGNLVNGLSAFIVSNNFEISLDPNNGYTHNIPELLNNQDNGNVTIYVRSSASAPPGYLSGTVTISTGTLNKTVTVNSVVSPAPVGSGAPLTQTVRDGAATTPITFTGTGGNTFTWTNDNPSIGLPAAGVGDIASFTAVNNGNTTVTANITAMPVYRQIAYVSNTLNNTISMIDVATNKRILPDIQTGASQCVLVSPDGTRIYIGNAGDNKVTVINAITHAVLNTINTTDTPLGMSISPDGKTLSVYNGNSNYTTTIDLTNDADVVTSITPSGLYPPGTPFSLDGKRAYVYNVGSSRDMSVYDTATGNLITTLANQSAFGGAVLSPDGTKVYVISSSSILVFDEASNTKINQIDHIGNENLTGLAMSPDGNTIYATSGNEGNVYAVGLAYGDATAINIGGFPSGVAISPGSGCTGPPVHIKINVEPTPPTITTDGTLDELTTPQGVPSPSTNFRASGVHIEPGEDIKVEAPPGFEVSTDGITFASTIHIGQGNNGTIPATPVYVRLTGATMGNFSGDIKLSSSDADDKYVHVSGIVTQHSPTVYASPVTGSIYACVGAISKSPFLQQFKVNGVILQGDVTVTAPPGFEVSLTPVASGFSAGLNIPPSSGGVTTGTGSLNSTIIYVRATAALAAGPISGSVTISSTGAVPLNVAVSGTINPLPTVELVHDQTVAGGQSTTPVHFISPNGANSFTWTYTPSGIGLVPANPASGAGDIPAFTAINNTSQNIDAVFTVTPKSAAFAYVANESQIALVNTGSNQVTTIPLAPIGGPPNVPYAVTASPDGNSIYVANRTSGTISVINTADNTVSASIPVGLASKPSGVVISPDGNWLYVANNASNDVSVIDLRAGMQFAQFTIQTGTAPLGIAITPDGKWVYVANQHPSGPVVDDVSAINTETHDVTKISLNAPGSTASGLAISPDGSYVYVTCYNTNRVSIISTATNTASLTTIGVGANPTGIAVSPDGSTLYVANSGAGTVSVISTATNGLIKTITVGANPNGICISPDGTFVYVTNTGSHNISVINTLTNEVVGNPIPVGGTPVSYGNFITGGTGCVGEPMTFHIIITPASSSVAVSGNLAALSTTYGTPSGSTSFAIAGNTINDAITVRPPTGFELSTDNTVFKQSLSIGAPHTTISSATVYVRLAAVTPVGQYSGNVTLQIGSGSPTNVPTVLSTVTPAPLTITADNKTKIAGQENPVLTASYNGFVNHETLSALTSLPVISTTALTDSPIGQYPITAGSALAPNYAITYVDGVFSIIYAPPAVSAPNIFTPNGDGINDLWNLKNISYYPGCTVNIYNRYGKSVFSSVGYGVPWDGRYNGAELPTGTYYYIIDLKNNTRPIAGSVTVIR